MSSAIVGQLERARRELLDLTARNRLLNTPVGRGRSTRLDIVDASITDIFHHLVKERREFGFLAAPDRRPVSSDSGVTENGETSGERLRKTDGRSLSVSTEPETGQRVRNLQTALDEEKLRTRLLRLYYDANAMFEEQGVNSLFLALGFLEWYEAPNSDKARFAPLLLIPVELHRRTVNARFRVKMLDEEVTTNLSLQAKWPAVENLIQLL